jgi:hypothetical protein
MLPSEGTFYVSHYSAYGIFYVKLFTSQIKSIADKSETKSRGGKSTEYFKSNLQSSVLLTIASCVNCIQSISLLNKYNFGQHSEIELSYFNHKYLGEFRKQNVTSLGKTPSPTRYL